jgi:hypothetical protein
MKTLKQLFARGGVVAALTLLLVAPTALLAQAAPAGATYKCGDGTYSTAKTSRGACSAHGGVAQALNGGAPSAPAAKPAATPSARAEPKATRGAGAPADANFKCGDGTFSSAKTARGACSQHGGVAETVGAAAKAPAAAATAKAEPKPRRGVDAPADATFKCGDGTFSSAKTSRGACSQHGGVAETVGAAATEPAATSGAGRRTTAAPAAGESAANATALCKDGTYSHSQHRSGTCSQHGGVDKWLKEPAN